MEEVIKDWVKEKTLSEADVGSWRSAASTWRLFYWDWARKQKYPRSANLPVEPWNDFGIPYLFSLPEVPVFPPTGGDSTMPNPLWNFENPEKDLVTKKSLPLGQMPEGKERWNIRDSPEKGDPDKPWEIPLPVSIVPMNYD